MACQNPEPRERLVRLKGRDDCHDCHFGVSGAGLQGAAGSGATETKQEEEEKKRLELFKRLSLLQVGL